MGVVREDTVLPCLGESDVKWEDPGNGGVFVCMCACVCDARDF